MFSLSRYILIAPLNVLFYDFMIQMTLWESKFESWKRYWMVLDQCATHKESLRGNKIYLLTCYIMINESLNEVKRKKKKREQVLS